MEGELRQPFETEEGWLVPFIVGLDVNDCPFHGVEAIVSTSFVDTENVLHVQVEPLCLN